MKAELPNPILELSSDNFREEVLESSTPILIDFWAPWCGPCRAMGPVLDEVATTLAGSVRVGKVNVDSEAILAGAFDVRSIPTCVLMRGRTVLNVTMGVMPAKQLVERIQNGIREEGENR